MMTNILFRSKSNTSIFALLTIQLLLLCSFSAKSQDPSENFEKGLVLYGEKNYVDAIEYFSIDLKNNPKSYLSLYYRGYSYARIKKFKEGEHDLLQLIKSSKPNPETYNTLGWLYNEWGKYYKAIDAFSNSIRLKPENPEAYNNRGISHQNLQNFRDAIADYSMSINLDSSFALAYCNRGTAIYYNQNVDPASKYDIRKAITDFNKALSLDPTLCIAYRNRGFCYIFNKDYNSAINDFYTGIECQPSDAFLWYGLGIAYNKDNNSKKGIEYLQKAIILNPVLFEAHIELAKSYIELSDYDKAIEHATFILSKNKSLSGDAYYHLARAYAGKNDMQISLKYLNKANSAGYFKKSENLNILKKDKLFDSFRSTKKYQKILKQN